MVIKIINKSDFKTETLKKVVDFCNKELIDDRTYEVKEIEFTNNRTLPFSGYYTTKSRRIRVSVNSKYNYPYKAIYKHKTQNLNYYNGYIDFIVLDAYECLIHVLAHELRHNWQKYNRNNKSKWTHNSYGKFSNKDADSYAIRKVREFRKNANKYKQLKTLDISW